MRGINLPDEVCIAEEEKYCELPTLLVTSELDYVTRPDLQTQNTVKWVKHLRIENIMKCGHWIQLERPSELHQLIQRFANEVAASPQ